MNDNEKTTMVNDKYAIPKWINDIGTKGKRPSEFYVIKWLCTTFINVVALFYVIVIILEEITKKWEWNYQQSLTILFIIWVLTYVFIYIINVHYTLFLKYS